MGDIKHISIKVVGKIDLPKERERSAKKIASENKPPSLLYRLHQKQKGKCHYCGGHTIPPKVCRGKVKPKNMATVEHLYPKNDIRRYTGGTDREYTVLACYGCNQWHGAKENFKFIEGLAEYKSVRKPIDIYKLEKIPTA